MINVDEEQGEKGPHAGLEGPGESIYERHRRGIVALIPRWYSPALHLVFPSLVGLAVLVFAWSRIEHLRAVELLTVPVTILVAFAFEWHAHKSVLHRRTPLVETIYERHELQHHVVYTYDNMALRDRRELWLILVPAYAILIIGVINAPLAYAASKLIAPNVGLVFLVTSMWYFITYEWLHFSYHLPASTFIGRSRVIARLREHHRRHHDPRLMKTWNFNVTVPAFDWVRGTIWSPEREAKHGSRRHRSSGSSSIVRPV